MLDVRTLSIEHQGITLTASYSPAGGTALLALHGAAYGIRDYFRYEHLHEVLPAAGIGVATFDRRGEGDSTGASSRGRFYVQVADAFAVLEALDAERVGLWGYSKGSWVGPLAAAASDRVAFPGPDRFDGGHAGRADAVRHWRADAAWGH